MFVVVLRFQCVCGCVEVPMCLWLCFGANVFVVVLRFQYVCGCVKGSICLWLC